jgi:hypothetical protein
MRLPVFTWLPDYERGWVRGDLVAGLTVWAVLVPSSSGWSRWSQTCSGAADGRSTRVLQRLARVTDGSVHS